MLRCPYSWRKPKNHPIANLKMPTRCALYHTNYKVNKSPSGKGTIGLCDRIVIKLRMEWDWGGLVAPILLLLLLILLILLLLRDHLPSRPHCTAPSSLHPPLRPYHLVRVRAEQSCRCRCAPLPLEPFCPLVPQPADPGNDLPQADDLCGQVVCVTGCRWGGRTAAAAGIPVLLMMKH
jgi:hypothetical protein